MIGKTISHYKILEKLGEGGMGIVYKAQDTKLMRTVALKFLPSYLKKSETDKARFLQEARAAAALNHNNVCTIHEIHDEGENPFIVMEYVEGRTLREIVQRKPPEVANLRRLVDVAIQIAEALKAAHKKGIVHRDIKSENIMVTETGQVKVMDFGLAKLRGSVKITKSSSTIGTIAYMSPEHIEGKEVDARTDIFSFGVVLYEMLTGQLPFKGEYDSAMMYAIVNEEPEPVQRYRSDLSSELLHVLNRALEKNPEVRYQSVNEMLIDLKRLQRDTDRVSRESIRRISATEKLKTPYKSRKRSWIYIFAAVVCIILVFWLGQRILRNGLKSQAFRENSIAVMYFEDRSGEEHFGKILAEMLTSNLSRCRQIDVVSSQHLFDILKRMGMEDIEAIDRSVATEVAASARVQTMLLGSIYKIGGTLNVNAQLCDVNTGSVIGPAQARGSNVEDIYQMVNGLTENVIQLMGVPRPDDSQPLKINDVTTHSFEAYKHYQKGKELCRRWNFSDGVKELREAVRIDTTFAMAHCLLALYSGTFKIMRPLIDLSKERESMWLAKKYSENVTDQERGIIDMFDVLLNRDFDSFLAMAEVLAEKYPEEKEIHYFLGIAHQYGKGNYEQAVQAYTRALEIDPEYGNVYNMLAYTYSALGDHEKAISVAKNYIALQPDVGNTYDTAYDIYVMAGRYEEAYQVCEDALNRNPAWTWLRQKESTIHLLRGEGDKAREKNRTALELDPSRELALVDDLGCFNMYEGRYREAALEFQRVIDLAHEKKNAEREIGARLVLGRFYNIQGKFSEAVKEFSRVKEISRKVYGRSHNTWPIRADYYSGVTAIRQGDYTEAMEFAERIKEYIASNRYDEILMDYYYILLAEIHVAKEEPKAASNMIDKVSRYPGRLRRLKADLLVLQGRIENAIQAYQKFYNRDVSDFEDFYLRSILNYRIAQLYEKKGDRQQAIFYYQRALEQWKNADEDLPALIDARARLARLQ